MWPFTSRSAERAKTMIELAEVLLVKKVEAEAKIEEARANAALKNLERELALKDRELRWVSEKREAARERAKKQRANPRPNARNRFGPVRRQTECALCDDPLYPNVTVAMIEAHAAHASRGENGQRDTTNPDLRRPA